MLKTGKCKDVVTVESVQTHKKDQTNQFYDYQSKTKKVVSYDLQ